MIDNPFKKFLAIALTTELTILICAGIFAGASRVYLVFRSHSERQQYEQFEQKQGALFDRAISEWQEKAFDVCLEAVQQVSSRSRVYDSAQTVGKYCQNAQFETWLQQGTELAAEQDYGGAIALVSQIFETHPPLYSEAQSLIIEWSAAILKIAKASYLAATKFPNEAIAIAAKIPELSPLYEEAQAKIAQWKQEWNANTKLEREAIAWLNADRLANAKQTVEQIPPTQPHWQTRREEILDDISKRQAEIKSWIPQAIQLAAEYRYKSAIDLVSQIPETHPLYPKAQTLIKNWSVAILNIAEESYFAATKFPQRAIDIASAIPPFSPLYQEAQAKIAAWRQEWKENSELEQEILSALDEEEFGIAKYKTEQMTVNTPHWQNRQEFLKTAIAQQQAAFDTFWNRILLFLFGGGLLCLALPRS